MIELDRFHFIIITFKIALVLIAKGTVDLTVQVFLLNLMLIYFNVYNDQVAPTTSTKLGDQVTREAQVFTISHHSSVGQLVTNQSVIRLRPGKRVCLYRGVVAAMVHS